MTILTIGDEHHEAETKAKFGDTHTYLSAHSQQEAEQFFEKSDVVFDFIIENDRSQMEVYRDHPHVLAFLNAAKVSLAELGAVVNHELKCTWFGFNGFPSFLNRPVLEVSLYKKETNESLESICKKLSTEFLVVDDRVGLVTPRVICMIINEAYFTVQEGTATREDIDLAMKLGTNYPYGPFEWAQKIGIRHVYELLSAVYEDTKDERYKICPLLKKEYLLYNQKVK